MKNLKNKIQLIVGVLFIMFTITLFTIDYTLHDLFVTFVLISIALVSGFIGIFMIIPAVKSMNADNDHEPMRGTETDPRIKPHADDMDVIYKYINLLLDNVNNLSNTVNRNNTAINDIKKHLEENNVNQNVEKTDFPIK